MEFLLQKCVTDCGSKSRIRALAFRHQFRVPYGQGSQSALAECKGKHISVQVSEAARVNYSTARNGRSLMINIISNEMHYGNDTLTIFQFCWRLKTQCNQAVLWLLCWRSRRCWARRRDVLFIPVRNRYIDRSISFPQEPILVIVRHLSKLPSFIVAIGLSATTTKYSAT